MSQNQRNDSSQMRELLQPHDQSDQGHKETPEHNSEGSSGQASCSSSSGPSRTVSHGPAEGDGCSRTQREDRSSSCCQLSDLKTLPQCDKKLGRLNFSKEHTVLIDVTAFKPGAALIPQKGRDMWHHDFVKMPDSHQNLITKTGLLKSSSAVRRWDVISKQLDRLAQKSTASVDDVEEAIMKYNPKYKGQWSFDALSRFLKCVPKEENHLYSKLFPKIAALASKLPEYVPKAVPLLKRGKAAAITLSQVQISCLLANAFFCTFPHRNFSGPSAEYHNYPTINFTGLFGKWTEQKKEKLRAIMHYFDVVTNKETKPKGLVTFKRRCLRDSDIPKWESCKETMPKLYVASHGSIERDGVGLLQVDFASSWIGGGVLTSGLVQEEILFLINPELIVSRLFTEKLEDNECLIITGSQQFSSYSGFRSSFEWAGPHEDRLGQDEWARLKRQILAIDALNFKHEAEQYRMKKVERKLNKAYCGFRGQGHDEPDIATGKWGCGAFHGDPQLKAVIQLMAAAKAKRGLAYFTFGDDKLKQGLQQIYHLLVKEGTTVEQLFGLLENYCAVQQAAGSLHVDLFKFMRENIGPSRSQL